jgi:hypothetical protein
MDESTVSVAVMVCVPAVFNVTENVPMPAVNVASAGSVAAPSLLVKCTVPAYVASGVSEASTAVTVISNAVPAVAVPGAEIVKCVAAAALAGDHTVVVKMKRPIALMSAVATW